MNKSLIIALSIMAVAAFIMILTRGTCDLNILGWHVNNIRTSIVILITMIAGVSAGVLLK